MAAVYSWQPNETCDLVIRHLVEGKCVAMPTESTYEIVASALHPDAVARLGQLRSESQRLAVVLFDVAEVFDWLPLLGGAALRVLRKLGPMTIALEASVGWSNGLLTRLPEATRRLLLLDGRITLRWPTDRIWEELRLVTIPLVSIPTPATTAAHAAKVAGDLVACVVDAGMSHFAQLPSISRVEGRRCRLIYEGVVKREQFDPWTACKILFICTGNTCRSPMAEALCTKLLADQLGCAPGEMKQHGFDVQSAGLAAMPGAQASPDAVRVVADLGADLSAHRSRPATMDMLAYADHIFTMTASHAQALAPLPQIPAPRLLAPSGDDVDDPIGGELADYRNCAAQIIQYLQERLPELLES